MFIDSEWINKLCSTHTLEYYTAANMNEPLPVSTWVNLRNYGTNKLRKNTYFMIFKQGLKISKTKFVYCLRIPMG